LASVVAIHGIGQHQRGRHQLLSAWRPAIADGIERATGRRVAEPPDLDIAFYGDLYLPPDGPATTKSGGDEVDRVLADMDDAECDELAEELGAELDLTVDAGDKGLSAVPRPLQVVLRALDRRFGVAAGVLSLGVLKQVRRYLLDPDLKASTDERVREAVGPDCAVIVAHSLGSIVAYEYLRQSEDKAITLVTIGSPLGLRMVRDRITVTGLAVPRWVAVRDPRDPVACAGDLAEWWPGTLDRLVDNGRDAHAAERYLGKRVVGEAVENSLAQNDDDPT
jgi:hypothetical protein